MSRTLPKGLAILWWVPFLVVADQITKALVRARLDVAHSHTVIPGFFSLRHAKNTGAAWGIFGDLPDGLRVPFFVVVSTGTSLLLLWYFIKVPLSERMLRWSLVSILAGAIGNLIDRAVFHEVTDFLDVYVSKGALYNLLVHKLGWSPHWPTFNVADICISVGVGMFIFYSMIIEPRQRKRAEAAEKAA